MLVTENTNAPVFERNYIPQFILFSNIKYKRCTETKEYPIDAYIQYYVIHNTIMLPW